MKPVKFKHQNMIFAENQPEYQQLPAVNSPPHECRGFFSKSHDIGFLLQGQNFN